jgi:DnaJ-class molecular chaperone
LSSLAPLEVQALIKIMDELDYYQILHLEPDASRTDVKEAFHQTSRTFHPDVNRHLEGQMLDDCAQISKRITEAYCVLRNPGRRKSYDQRLSEKAGLRIQLAEATAAHAKQESQERQGKTPEGRQFFQKATEDLRRDDWVTAENNLKMALTFEASNDLFKEKLEEVRKHNKQRK